MSGGQFPLRTLNDVAVAATPDALLAPDDRAHLQKIGERWPSHRLVAYEVRLGAPGQVDWSGGFGPHDAAMVAAAFAGADDPAGRAIATLAQAWQAGHPALDGVTFVYLEADLPPGGSGELAGIYLEFPDRRVPHLGLVERLSALAHLLTGQPLPAARLAALEHSLAMLPPGAWIAFVGLMTGRPESPIRLVARAPLPELFGMLEGFALDAARQALDLPILAPFARLARLAWDVTDRVAPRVGVELFAPTFLQNPAFWRETLQAFVDAGLARADRAEAFAAWRHLLPLPKEAIQHPGERAVLALLLPRYRPVAMAYPSHLKLSALPDGSLELKGYLFATLERARPKAR